MLLVAAAYRAAVWGAHRLVGDDRPLENEFLLNLVPIALVYAVAHYFTYLVIQGQSRSRSRQTRSAAARTCSARSTTRPISRRSRPTRSGTSGSGRSSPATAGLAVAHDQAVSILSERDALRSQYAMLALMVIHTVGGLWLLSRG